MCQLLVIVVAAATGSGIVNPAASTTTTDTTSMAPSSHSASFSPSSALLSSPSVFGPLCRFGSRDGTLLRCVFAKVHQ
ncbi:hypothetical protein K1719_019674 [Acacia pycnantha]|nr:hypothetical protein K1719_019674 [Acacia pycnantha]